ncbi:hypothetical protein EV714DRAFT_270656 [Schizophyllum commune]
MSPPPKNNNPFVRRSGLRPQRPSSALEEKEKKSQQRATAKAAKEKANAQKKQVDVPAIAEIENEAARKEAERRAAARELSKLPEAGPAMLNGKPGGRIRPERTETEASSPEQSLQQPVLPHLQKDENDTGELPRAPAFHTDSEGDGGEEGGAGVEALFLDSEYASAPPTSGDEDELQPEKCRSEPLGLHDWQGSGSDEGIAGVNDTVASNSDGAPSEDGDDIDDMDPEYYPGPPAEDQDEGGGEHNGSEEEEHEGQKKPGRGKTSTSTRGDLRAQVAAYRSRSAADKASPITPHATSSTIKRKHNSFDADQTGGTDVRPVHLKKRPKNALPHGLVSNWKDIHQVTPAPPSSNLKSIAPSRRSSTTSDHASIEQHGGFQDDEKDGIYHEDAPAGSAADRKGADDGVRRVSQMPVLLVKKDINLRASKAGGRIKKERFSNKHLPACTRTPAGEILWKTEFLPTVISYCGCLRYSWTASSQPGTITLLKQAFSNIFGDEHADVDLSIGGPVFFVTMQRLVDYRHGFAATANAYLYELLMKSLDPEDDEKLQFPTQVSRKQLIAQYKPGMSYMYSDPDFENHKNSTGIYRSGFYLAVLAHHFKCAQGALNFRLKSSKDGSEQQTPHPVGAMALAAVATERAFKAWKTGAFVEPDDFSYNNYKNQTMTYVNHIRALEQDVLLEILAEAYNVYSGKQAGGNESSAAGDDSDSDDAREQLGHR